MEHDVEETLPGGYSHPGQVVKVGDTVRRPRNPHGVSAAAVLAHLAHDGRVQAPVPLGIDSTGREMFSFVEGAVPFPPYPVWAVSDEVLEGVGALLRRYHDAMRSFVIEPGMTWAPDLADPRGGPIVCHNDVCLENVVFSDGAPYGLIDFDLAAPGRPVYDIAMALRLCGPVGHPALRQPSFENVDAIERVAVFCRGYGLDAESADELVDALIDACRVAARFVESRAAAGMAWFTEIWSDGGVERYAAHEAWIVAHAPGIRDAARAGS